MIRKCLAILFGMLCVLSLGATEIDVSADEGGVPQIEAPLPTNAEIDQVYKDNPEIIYEMVRKLVSIESTTPQLLMPDLLMIELDDGAVKSYFEGKATVTIGSGDYRMTASWELDQLNATYARKECPDFPWGWVALGGAVLFTTGVLVGGFALH